MQRNLLEIFQIKLKSHRIQTKVLALEAGRSASYLSEIFTGKKSPTLQTFACLLEAADRLSPGFADEYYSALAGNLDVGGFVKSLGTADLSTLLILTGQRLGEVLPGRQKVPA